MKRKALVAGLIATGLAASTVDGYSAEMSSFLQDRAGSAPEARAIPTDSAAVPANPSGLLDFTTLAARCGPAVVSISVSEYARPSATGRYSPPVGGDFRESEFSKGFQFPLGPDELSTRGVGSGFIVNAEGLILTSANLVDGAERIDVRLTDDREFEAKVVGVDNRSDVAVLRIGAAHLPTVKLGNSADTRVGDWVFAIGSPFGLDRSVSRGIVSAKSRALPGESYVPFIQTNVPVNPGNSGSPLFNMRGEVIGINAQIFSRSGGYQGLSFAIPIDIASNVATQLLRRGKVTRGRLGVTGQEVTQGLADAFGLQKLNGVLVSAVEPAGPAATAGIEPGDVILALDDRVISNSIDLPAQVAEIKPGTSVKLMVVHRGKTKAVNVTVDQLQDKQGALADMQQ